MLLAQDWMPYECICKSYETPSALLDECGIGGKMIPIHFVDEQVSKYLKKQDIMAYQQVSSVAAMVAT